MKEFNLPKDFLLGSATAASQIEGNDYNTNWYHWYEQGMIENNDNPFIASDHFHHLKEDLAILKELNQDVYRMSIEWSRIEPREGEWSVEGLKYYRREIKALLKAGIKPLVTLHHFSHPQWFEEKGQWTSDEAVRYFLRFVKVLVINLGDLISEYCTINEPNVMAMGSYLTGEFPPGKKDDLKSYFKVSKNFIIAHIKAYELIHKIRERKGFTDTKVGFAMHYTYLEADKKCPMTKHSVKAMNYLFHTIFEKGFFEGKASLPICFNIKRKYDSYCDFMGINYYTRHVIYPSKNIAMLFGEAEIDRTIPKGELSDLGWQIYPDGLYNVVKAAYEKYPMPVYITENGIADDADEKRVNYIYEHLKAVSNLIEDGVDVKRFYYWSTMDNLEWSHGYWPRFGLVEIDYENGKRTIRKSGRFYSEICKNKKVTNEMIEKYL